MDFRSTFENLKDRATDLAQAGVAQSKRLAEIAKLKTANMAGASAAACEKITAAKAAIEANNDRIAELKQPGDPEPVEEVVEAAAETAADAVEAVTEEEKQD